MNQIDVVVDVRQSPDTAELIVSKQKVAFSGEAHLVGSPVESRIGLITRKAQVSVFEFAEAGYGFVVGATVKNIGTVPFEITRVGFEHKYEQPQEVRHDTIVVQDLGGSVNFLPRNPARKGPLQPGEEREFYLPQDLYDGVALLCFSLRAEQFWIAAFSGTEEVGRAGGESIRPFFDRVPVVFHRRAVPLFGTLPEEDRLAVIRAVAPPRGVETDRWPSLGAEPLEGVPLTFVVRAGEELGVLVTRTEDNKVEVVDIFRESALDQVDTSDEGSQP
jgi:hypothetical protein